MQDQKDQQLHKRGQNGIRIAGQVMDSTRRKLPVAGDPISVHFSIKGEENGGHRVVVPETSRGTRNRRWC